MSCAPVVPDLGTVCDWNVHISSQPGNGGSSSAKAISSAPVLLLILIAFGYAVYAADRTVLSSVLAPIKSALALTSYQIGLLGSAQYIGVLSLVFMAGHLSDRYGRGATMIAGVTLFTVFTWLIGLASNFPEAFLFRLVSGFGEGIFWPVAMAAVATLFGGRKGVALGVFYIGFDAGSVAGLSLGGLAYYLLGDWRPVFFVAPSLGLLAIAGLVASRSQLDASSHDAERITMGADALRLLRRKDVILLMVFAFLMTWASVWQVVFLPYYFFTVMSFTVLSSALLSSIVVVSGAVGKFVLGGASDRWNRSRLLLLCSAAALLSYFVFFSSLSLAVEVVSAASMGFFSSAVFPIVQALTADWSDGRTGTALGLTTTSQSVATVISPVIAAALFLFGVGRALALDAMIPTAAAGIVALMMTEPRGSPAGNGETPR